MFGVGTSENPHVKFEFDLPADLMKQSVQRIEVFTVDNEGKTVNNEFH